MKLRYSKDSVKSSKARGIVPGVVSPLPAAAYFLRERIGLQKQIQQPVGASC